MLGHSWRYRAGILANNWALRRARVSLGWRLHVRRGLQLHGIDEAELLARRPPILDKCSRKHGHGDLVPVTGVQISGSLPRRLLKAKGERAFGAGIRKPGWGG